MQLPEKPGSNSCKCVGGWAWLHSYGRVCFGGLPFQAEAVYFVWSVEACFGSALLGETIERGESTREC